MDKTEYAPKACQIITGVIWGILAILTNIANGNASPSLIIDKIIIIPVTIGATLNPTTLYSLGFGLIYLTYILYAMILTYVISLIITKIKNR